MPPAGGAPVAAPATTPAHHLDLRLRSLSERERQILVLVTRGYSNRRIAEVSYLSLNTVRTHVQNVLVKLGVHSKLEAAARTGAPDGRRGRRRRVPGRPRGPRP